MVKKLVKVKLSIYCSLVFPSRPVGDYHLYFFYTLDTVYHRALRFFTLLSVCSGWMIPPVDIHILIYKAVLGLLPS